MARKKSEFLGALGTCFQIFKTIADAVMEEGGSDDDLRKVLQPGNGLARNIALLVTGKAAAVTPDEAIAVMDGKTTLREVMASQFRE